MIQDQQSFGLRLVSGRGAASTACRLPRKSTYGPVIHERLPTGVRCGETRSGAERPSPRSVTKICWAVENNSFPIWQLIKYWPHNHHHFSYTFRITCLIPFMSMMINTGEDWETAASIRAPSIPKKPPRSCLFGHCGGKRKCFLWCGEILKLP